ncbi:MAG TPA: polyprenyl diphosphate synthase [Acidobacteriota bacterium]|nr:polyprenyl diphosphate synthase [Acidobacteriota bacterium]
MFNFEGLIEPGSRDEALLSQLDPQRMPSHIAIIMDGNGRWAKRQGKPRVMGHPAGIESVREIVETCARLGITTLTLYTFSTENWRRPRFEIDMLWKLLRECLHKEIDLLDRNNVQLRFIGRLHEIESSLLRDIQKAEQKLHHKTGLVLNIAFNYSGRAELTDAFRALATECQLTGRSPQSITEDDIARHLYIGSDPDLLIRTSGEMRLSNFLLWQLAYTEIVITDTLWPDFRRPNLFESILAFQNRDRRFGGIEATNQKKPARV